MSKLFSSFSAYARDTILKVKLKFHFLRTVLILAWFWYLDIVAKRSSPFSSVWQSKLFSILRSNLGAKFWKYLLKVSAISKSSVNSLPFSIRDIFSELFDLSKKKLFTVQKQPPEVFYIKRCSQKFDKIHRKTPVPESLFL